MEKTPAPNTPDSNSGYDIPLNPESIGQTLKGLKRGYNPAGGNERRKDRQTIMGNKKNRMRGIIAFIYHGFIPNPLSDADL